MKNLKTFESFHQDTIDSLNKAKEEFTTKTKSIIDKYRDSIMDCMSDLVDNHKYEYFNYGEELESTFKFTFDINDLDKIFVDLTDVYEKLDGVLGNKPSIEIYYTRLTNSANGRRVTKHMSFIPAKTALNIDKIINHFRRDISHSLIDLNAYDVVNKKVDTTNSHQINLGYIEFIMKMVIR